MSPTLSARDGYARARDGNAPRATRPRPAPARSLLAVLLAVAATWAMVGAPPIPARAESACVMRDLVACPFTAMVEDSTWTALPAMPRPRSELGAAAIDGVVYVVGGFGGPSLVDRFDTSTGTWSEAADLPVGVHHPGVAALDGRLYVAGGYAGDAATAALWAYDPATDAWERRADMPTARGALGLAPFAGRLYAVGGATEGLGGPVTAAVEAYDPAADAWQAVAAMPTPREHLAVVAGPDRVFAVGGRANGDERDVFAGAAEAYDPLADRWEALPPLPTPRGGLAGAFAAGRVVILGGERGPRSYDDAEAYDPVGRTWTALPPLPTPRHGLAAAGIGDTVYAIAGSTRARAAQQTGAFEALTLPAD